jgi:hypothetical protein
LQPPDDPLRPVQPTRNRRIESLLQPPSTRVVISEWPVAPRCLILSHNPDATPHQLVGDRSTRFAGTGESVVVYGRRHIRACVSRAIAWQRSPCFEIECIPAISAKRDRDGISTRTAHAGDRHLICHNPSSRPCLPAERLAVGINTHQDKVGVTAASPRLCHLEPDKFRNQYCIATRLFHTAATLCDRVSANEWWRCGEGRGNGMSAERVVWVSDPSPSQYSGCHSWASEVSRSDHLNLVGTSDRSRWPDEKTNEPSR